MTRILLLSSSCVLVLILVCLSQECSGRHLSSIDDHDKAKLLNHDSTIKGFGNNPFTVHDELDHPKQIDGGTKNKKDMLKDQKVKKFKEVDLQNQHQHQQHDPKYTIFRVRMKHRQIHPQPGFNLDYSPPKTHPPSHN